MSPAAGCVMQGITPSKALPLSRQEKKSCGFYLLPPAAGAFGEVSACTA